MDIRKRFTPKLIVCYVLIALFLLWARPAPGRLVLGSLLILAGELLRIWGTGHLRKNEAVITSGPYAYVRDPLYIGTLSILTGFCIAAHIYELLILVWLVFFIYYMPYKQKREGDRLSRKFGKTYDDYRREVKSIVPRLTPYKDADSGTKWNPRLVWDNSEIGTAVSIILFFAFLIAKSVFFPDMVFPGWHLF